MSMSIAKARKLLEDAGAMDVNAALDELSRALQDEWRAGVNAGAALARDEAAKFERLAEEATRNEEDDEAAAYRDSAETLAAMSRDIYALVCSHNQERAFCRECRPSTPEEDIAF